MGSLEFSGEGRLGVVEVKAAVYNLNKLDVFHLFKEVLGFVLYMHEQIPTCLQHMEREFDSLKEEYGQLETSNSDEVDRKVTFQRKNKMKRTDIKQRIKKLEKLMNCISGLLSAMREAIDEIPNFWGFMLVLGGSLSRPEYVYEVFFDHVTLDPCSAKDSSTSKIGDILSRKAIQALLTNTAENFSYSGPKKLFLLIKCPSSFNLPLHFLPKRDYRYSKKVCPIKLYIKGKVGDQSMNDVPSKSEKPSFGCSAAYFNETDMIWYQCRHSVKGLVSKSEETDC
ncbi:hypothetical protein AXF42_Ash005265 [Apostasia shenzhenica]|uniref:Uncharacterized protein n=1 Tax=Apostasia shenzhenica TaxID=1088818 RepID=A0A2I0B6G8_9ASPA|nr:hypothetical protein AXF42_Ash005265 [Apostasia shenzhenica]